MKDRIDKIIENHALKIIILLQIILSLRIFFTRFFSYDKIMIGNSSYFHAIKAGELLSNSFSNLINYHPYQILIAITDKLFNNLEITSQIIPIILAIISITLLFKTLKQIKTNPIYNFTTCILVILSPIYIYISTVSNQYILSALIILFSFYLLTKFNNLAVLIIFLITPFLGVFETILSIILLLSYATYIEDDRKRKRIILISIIVLITLFYFPTRNINILHDNIFILKFITSFGAYLGFSIFSLLLVAIGFFFTWKNKKRLIPIYITTLFLFLSFIYLGQYANIFLNFIFCYFGAIALIHLVEYKWNFDIVRDLTIIVLICGLLFTTIACINRLSHSPPDQEIKLAILEIEKRTPDNSIILSDPAHGFWIQYFAQRKTINDLFRINQDTKIIFNSRDISTVSRLLDKNKIDFIYITPYMKQKLWTSDEEGLLFLLPYKGKFRKVYTKKGHDIWKIIREKK